MAQEQLTLVRGTLDLLILKTLTWGPAHGYAITFGIRHSTDGALLVEEGALYPALYRMEAKGWIASHWGLSENNRRAKYYALTAKGRKHFQEEVQTWNAYATAVRSMLSAAKPDDAPV
jgi:PadR family transcriptional regulator PadR